MQVKMLVSIAGANGVFAPGDVVEFSEAEAQRMIAAGTAEPVRVARVEKAARKPRGEKAVK
jgi:spermidine/putrescine-binding protein